MKKQLLIVAIAAAAGYAQADYQYELGAGYVDGEEANADYDGYGLNGEFFFNRVDTSKGPLAEASFLDKASSIDFNYWSVELDAPGADDTDTFAFGGRFVTGSNLIIEGDYSSEDEGNDDVDTIRFGVGTYLNDNTDVVVSYETTDEDTGDLDVLSADLHGVRPLQQGQSIAFDLGLSYIDADDDDGYSISAGGTFYFSNMFGIGVSAELQDIDTEEKDTVSIDASFFPQENIELTLSYFDSSTEFNGGAEVDSDGIMFGGAVRF